MSSFDWYHFPCPLCQQDVDISQPDCYRVLPMDSAKMSLYKKKIKIQGEKITLGHVKAATYQTYPALGYMRRMWLLHKRCLDFVKHLPLPKIYLLLHLVEPSLLSRSIPPSTPHGAFYTEPTLRRSRRKAVQKVSRIGLHTAIPKKAQVDGSSGGLPFLSPEIWDMILQHDIGRLLFIMRIASQLAPLNITQHSIPDTRFTVEVLDLQSPILQIHLVNIGQRQYVGRLSNSADRQKQTENAKIRCYNVSRNNYLAVKTDRIGVVDMAFELSSHTGQPNWLLRGNTRPFEAEISQIRDANLRSFRIIRDVGSNRPSAFNVDLQPAQALKCRAIVPSNRGPEPYFRSGPFPPTNSWVKPGFLIKSKLTEQNDPHMYFTPALYVPFADMKRATFAVDRIATGLKHVYANGHVIKSPLVNTNRSEWYSFTFTEPPTTMKFIVCECLNHNYPFIQVCLH